MEMGEVGGGHWERSLMIHRSSRRLCRTRRIYTTSTRTSSSTTCLTRSTDGSSTVDKIFVHTRNCISNSVSQDLNWELEVARRKKRWKAKENEIRTGEVSEGGKPLEHNPKEGRRFGRHFLSPSHRFPSIWMPKNPPSQPCFLRLDLDQLVLSCFSHVVVSWKVRKNYRVSLFLPPP